MTCKTKGCDGEAIAKGRCNRCYLAQYRGYKPKPMREVVPRLFVGANIPEELGRRFRRQVRKSCTSITTAVEEAIQSWLAKREGRK